MFKMLLVDPDLHSREQLLSVLDWKRLGISVQSHAQLTSDVLSALEKQPVSLILINLRQSSANSLDICEQILRKSSIPIILISGSRDFQLVRRAILSHVIHYFPIPPDPCNQEASRQTVCNCLSAAPHTDPHSNSGAAARKPKRASTLSIIEVIKNYVQEEMHKNITLKEISAMLHFNCAYLGQKFKQQENMTFNEYLLQQRMEKAKKLLAETDMKIYEVAYEVGYTETDWFYKKFKEYTGRSANEYRKKTSYSA